MAPIAARHNVPETRTDGKPADRLPPPPYLRFSGHPRICYMRGLRRA